MKGQLIQAIDLVDKRRKNKNKKGITRMSRTQVTRRTTTTIVFMWLKLVASFNNNRYILDVKINKKKQVTVTLQSNE